LSNEIENYNEIVNNMVYSFSNENTFEGCKYAWKLIYIDKKERSNNFFGEVGTLFHEILEKYFKKEIESYELVPFFQKNYKSIVKSDPPLTMPQLRENYYQDGIRFFSDFDFPRDNYKVLQIENKNETILNGIKFVFKPDLILKDLKTNQIILLDHKTSNPYTPKGTIISSKIVPYIRQLELYASALWIQSEIEVNQLWLWFVRYNKIEKFVVDPVKTTLNLNRFYDIINQIKEEKEFMPNPSNKFFCQNLCSCSDYCEYKPI